MIIFLHCTIVVNLFWFSSEQKFSEHPKKEKSRVAWERDSLCEMESEFGDERKIWSGKSSWNSVARNLSNSLNSFSFRFRYFCDHDEKNLKKLFRVIGEVRHRHQEQIPECRENRWSLECGRDKILLIRKVRKLSKEKNFFQLCILKRKLELIFQIFTGFLLHQRNGKKLGADQTCGKREKKVERKINGNFFGSSTLSSS